MAGKRVLIVDDEKLIVKGIRFSLEQDDMTEKKRWNSQTIISMILSCLM